MFEDQVKDQPQPLLLGEFIQSNDTAQIKAVFDQSSPVDITRMISGIAKPDQIRFLEILGRRNPLILFRKYPIWAREV